MTQKLRITIEEEAGRVPFDGFLMTVSQAVHILRGLDRVVSRADEPTANWSIIEATMRSPMAITLEPTQACAERTMADAINPFLLDIDRLEKGLPTKYMTASLRERAKKLVGVLGRGIRSITFSSNGTEVRPTQRVAAAVDELRPGGRPFEDSGSIEGSLDILSVHGRESATVYDEKSGKAVPCRLTAGQIEEAKELLGKRVIMRGVIRYERAQPHEIVNVFGILPLGGTQELPQPDKIGPIDFGDVEPADYLRGEDNV